MDLNDPFRNREVSVFMFNDEVGEDNKVHNGFEIIVEGNMHAIFDDAFEATLLNPSEILIRVPSASYPLLHQEVAFHGARDKLVENTGPVSTKALYIARHTALQDKASQSRYLLLRFPKSMPLTNEIYSPNSKGEIKQSNLGVDDEIELNGKVHKMYSGFVFWRVSIEEPKRREVKKDTPKTRKQLLEEKLQGMTI